MTDYRELSNTLTFLEKTSREIISKTLKLAKKVGYDENDIEDNEYVRRVREEAPSASPEAVWLNLQSITRTYTVDAEKVLKEIPSFMKRTGSGGYEPNPECKFLMEVWHGDVYGSPEVDGLKELLAEMTAQLKTVTEEDLLEKAIGMVSQ